MKEVGGGGGRVSTIVNLVAVLSSRLLLLHACACFACVFCPFKIFVEWIGEATPAFSVRLLDRHPPAPKGGPLGVGRRWERVRGDYVGEKKK